MHIYLNRLMCINIRNKYQMSLSFLYLSLSSLSELKKFHWTHLEYKSRSLIYARLHVSLFYILFINCSPLKKAPPTLCMCWPVLLRCSLLPADILKIELRKKPFNETATTLISLLKVWENRLRKNSCAKGQWDDSYFLHNKNKEVTVHTVASS